MRGESEVGRSSAIRETIPDGYPGELFRSGLFRSAQFGSALVPERIPPSVIHILVLVLVIVLVIEFPLLSVLTK